MDRIPQALDVTTWHMPPAVVPTIMDLTALVEYSSVYIAGPGSSINWVGNSRPQVSWNFSMLPWHCVLIATGVNYIQWPVGCVSSILEGSPTGISHKELTSYISRRPYQLGSGFKANLSFYGMTYISSSVVWTNWVNPTIELAVLA